MPNTPYQLLDGVALITLNNPPVNALSLAVRRHLADAFDAASRDPAVRALVVQGAGRSFSGGGDIREFDNDDGDALPDASDLFSLIEASPKPVVAALRGVALGGGLELALACHARVAHAATQVGLPEVHLGLVPGAGGTQRLPRLIGLEAALNLIVQGRTVTVQSLADCGLCDQVLAQDDDGQVLAVALSLARSLATEGRPRPVGERSVTMPNAQAFLAVARTSAQTQGKELPAPVACIDCLDAAVTKPLKEGLAFERDTFRRMQATAQSAGLRHVFLAERAAGRVHGLAADVKPRPLASAVVVGAGTMGVGIAMSLVNAGMPVAIIEREQAALDRGVANIRSVYEGMVKKGRITAAEMEVRMARIQPSLDYEPTKKADLIVEAAFEDYAVKQSVFEQLDALAKPGALLATNTSTLNIDRIARPLSRATDVLGLHFFSPAHVMPLLEVVRGARTAPDVLATALQLARKIKKTAVVSGVCDGFIGNRMFEPYMMQAGLLLDEGALPQQVDRAMEAWGMAMGPFRVNDLAGNDLAQKIRQRRLAEHPELVFSGCFDAVVAMGRFGQKVGKGWYDHRPGQRVPQPSAAVEAAVVAESARLGLTRRTISDDEIVERLLLALVNEGAKVLEEGIAQRASDIDVVYTAGYGFARWRGGPMFQADRMGLDRVLAAMAGYAHGPAYQRAQDFWQPAALLRRLAQSGQALQSFSPHATESHAV